GDFAAGVAQALTGWMRRQGLGAAVQVSAGLLAVGEPRSLEEVPLADGNHLIVRPTETTDASWPQLLAQVWRYVIRQNSLLSSEQELREEGL
ncbi:hypothetical protein NL455_27930, partial [Klebsiella pneumoniae]|nr:hypothetical protein [Klebsiella pneumoniae]